MTRDVVIFGIVPLLVGGCFSKDTEFEFQRQRCFAGADLDVDGVCEADDNCPATNNRAQVDSDGDGMGDACDPCPIERQNKCAKKLQFWFRFEDVGADESWDSLAGFRGDLLGGAAIVANAGFYGAALEMDGTKGSKLDIEIPSQLGSLENVMGEITQFQLEARVKGTPTGREATVVFTDPIAFTMSISPDGTVRCLWQATDWVDPREVLGQTDVLDGEWHHVACVRSVETEGGSLTPKVAVLVDGRVDGAQYETFGQTKLVTAWWLTIGADVNGNNAFDGLIDDVRMGEVALEYTFDWDWDGIANGVDNCPLANNPGQLDGDGDLRGDACGRWNHMTCTDEVHCDNKTACASGACKYGECVYEIHAGQACDDGDPYSTDDVCGEDGVCRGRYAPRVFAEDTVLKPGHHRFGPLKIEAGAVVTCQGDTGDYYGRGCVINAPSVEIEQGAELNADGQGFAGLRGPGGGCIIGPECPDQGAGHGGLGGFSGDDIGCSRPYGAAGFPTSLGSGAANGTDQGPCEPGARGGGAIELQIYEGPLHVDGRISALPERGGRAGASGGSILLQTPSLTGTGILDVSGGDGIVAGGSGGRLAIYGDTTTFDGVLLRAGGSPDTDHPGHDGTMVVE